MTTSKQLRKALESDWAADGEQILGVLGGDDLLGHVGAVIGGSWTVPCPAPAGGPEPKSVPELPELISLVRDGRFLGDEWLHDPAMRAVAYADSPEQAAVVCGGYLAAFGGQGWYVSTSSRVAVVAHSSALSGAAAESAEDESGGAVGRLWGRARSVVSAVSDGITSLGGGWTTVWEVPASKEDGALVNRGRSPRGWSVERQVFADGSAIELRTEARAFARAAR